MKRKLYLLLSLLLLTAIHAAATPASLSIEDFSIQAGETKEMLIDLNSPDADITLVQFDLRLPEGLSIPVVNGYPAVDIAGRTNWRTHTLETNEVSGALRVLLYSSRNATIPGTSGALISVTLEAAPGFNGGDIVLEDILLVTPQQAETKPDNLVYTIEGNVPVLAINLNLTSYEMSPGNTVQLSATVYPANATNKSVKWSSNNSAIATVDDNGLVTAVAGGSAAITCEALDGTGVKATCMVTVKETTVFVSQIILNATTLEITQGDTFQLTATVLPSNATNKSLKWTSSNDSVVTVNSNGLVNGVKPGSAVIVCEAQDGSNVWKMCNVNVKAPVIIDAIQFADVEVKRICVENWDTNGDGELSKEEAAAVTSIGTVFKGNKTIVSFKELEFFKGITSLEHGAFSDCEKLEDAVIPDNVTCISSLAFYRCLKLQHIEIPKNVVEIESSAFSICKELSTISVEDGNTVYDSRNNCNAIIRKSDNTLILGCQNTIIPNDVTSIGIVAFSNSKLTHIVIPASVTSIGERAFWSCSDLSTIIVESDNPVYDSRNNCNAIIRKSDNTLIVGSNSTIIPNSVTCIGEEAFYLRTSLSTIAIPKSVISIRHRAFAYCYGLTAISIPESVVDFGESVFWGSHGITSVTVEWPIPIPYPENFNWDSQIAKSTLYVPYGSKAAYLQAEGWKNFQNIIEMEAAEPELKVEELIVEGDGIVGTQHSIYCYVMNHGATYTGKIYIHGKNSGKTSPSSSLIWANDIPQGYSFTRTIGIIFQEEGSFRIWLSTDEEGNNVLGETTWIVTPAATLTAKSYTREYGDENPDFGYTADKGGFNGTPKITCMANKFSDVGIYDIIIEQGSVDNQYVKLVPGKLTITKAPLKITANNYTIKQGDPMPTFTARYEGFKLGETENVLTKKPQFSCPAFDSSEPGEFPIRVYGYEAKNYAITPVDGLLTIEEDESGYTLVVELKNGRQEMYVLKERPQAWPKDDKLQIATATLSTSYNRTDIKECFFLDKENNPSEIEEATEKANLAVRQTGRGRLIVTGLEDSERITIFDLSGRLMDTILTDGSETTTVDLSQQPKGIYIVNINNKRTIKLQVK